MKHLINLIIIFSLFSQVCNAQRQRIKNIDEYKVIYDSLVYKLKTVEKDTSYFIGKPVSDFVKQIEKCGLKVITVWLSKSDNKPVEQHLYAIRLLFLTDENFNFVRNNNMRAPSIIIEFKESQPYQQALSLFQKYGGDFEEEVEEFYSDAVIKEFEFYFPESIHDTHARRRR